MDKKKILWSLLSLLLAMASIYAIIAQDNNFSFNYFINYIVYSDKRFLVPAVFTMCGYFFFEGFAIARMSHHLGYGGSKTGLIYGAADVYFSAITPSASGGQPATAFFMMLDGIPGATSMVMLLMNLIMYTLSIIVFGGFSMLTAFSLYEELSILSRVLIVLGLITIITLGIIFLLLLCRGKMLYRICDVIIVFLGRIGLIRRTDHYREKLAEKIEEYEECSDIVRGHKRLLFEVFVLNIFQRASQVATTALVYLSAGFGLKTAIKVWHIQNFTVLGSNFIPIPGAMGVADYLMLDGYGQIPEIMGIEAEMEILCRGMSFYVCILLCGIILIAGYIRRRIKGIKC